MNAQQARALVTETFTKPFDRGRFRNFVINLLNNIDESKAQSWNTTYIKDAFKKDVKSYQRLGTYTTPESDKLDVLVVHLTTEAKLERARSAIRNFVAHHLKTRDSKDAALVAFVSPTERHWRFSYVTMEYAAIEKQNGRVGVQTTLTPARRSSYIVGEGESCHTAQSRFLNLLQDTENQPTLERIENAFSVEAVTKEFFEQYKTLFLDLKEQLDKLAKKDTAIGREFRNKQVSTSDFAKKLMGQIVFLYFLQKKGWLGVEKDAEWGEGPHDFLRRLYNQNFRAHTNFFNDLLEPLFYDTLATDRGHEAWSETLHCRIPFLNGGLFEPLAGYDWQKTDIAIPNSLFSNAKTTTAGDTGTGILDVFDRYNFTVNEAEPLEKEVAIDPEMLGKVFENLLGVDERQSKGSYYTPREIVHYMCQESLINYLDTTLNTSKESIAAAKTRQTGLFAEPEPDQAEFTTKIRRELVSRTDLETFIHSGDQASYYEAARVEGTGYSRKLPKTIETHARLIDDRLSEITVCDPAIGSGAFPVGMMQEIVRARSALTPYFNDVHDRTPYQFKRHAIQSCLYGVDIDPGAVEIAKLRLWLSLVVDEEDVQHIKPLPNLAYKIVSGNSLLGVERTLFNQDLFSQLESLKPVYFDESDQPRKATLKAEIDTLIRELTSGSEIFDFHIYFSEVFHKRDGFDVVIANPPYDVLNVTEGHRIARDSLEAIRAMPEYKTALGGKLNLFRLFTVRGLHILAKDGCLTFIIPYGFMCDSSSKNLRESILKQNQLVFVEAFPERDDPKKRLFESAKMSTCIILVRNSQTREQFPVRTHYARQIKKDVPTVHLDYKLVEQLDPINFSIPLIDETKLSIVKKLMSPKLRRMRELGRCYQGEINLTFHKKYLRESKRGNARMIKGAAIQRYLLKDTMSQGEILYLDEESFLRAHGAPKTEHHALKRIIMQGMTGVNEKTRLKMTISDEGAYCAHSVNYLLLHNNAISHETLLAILNSTLLNWFFKLFSTNSNVNSYEVENLPIPTVDTIRQKRLAELSNRILAAKRRNPETDTSSFELQIDEIVFELYGLSKEEKALVQVAD
jgi:Alw26I/Eco31I/Esp3I family type II restriction m6 adenine DNA methyltransferase